MILSTYAEYLSLVISKARLICVLDEWKRNLQTFICHIHLLLHNYLIYIYWEIHKKDKPCLNKGYYKHSVFHPFTLIITVGIRPVLFKNLFSLKFEAGSYYVLNGRGLKIHEVGASVLLLVIFIDNTYLVSRLFFI